jgi:tight adherence protein C
MEIDPGILSAAVFVVIVLLYLAGSSVYSTWKSEQNLLQRTEKWCSVSQTSLPTADKGASTGADKREGAHTLWTLLGLPGAKKEDRQESIYSGTPLFYQRAGIYDAASLRYYQVLRYSLFALPFLLLAISHAVAYRPFSRPLLLIACLFAAIGYYLPVLWLKIRASSRKKELDRTFPDAIDLLMVCVQAGMGLDSAIRRVSQEIHVSSPELAKEFKILSLELKTGKSRNICLKNLAQRTDLPDIDNLVSLLIQADKYGTGISRALQVHAEDMRQKRYARLEEMAAKLPVKLVVPLIFFIFPALFVVIIGPGAIQIFHSFIEQ